MLKNYYHNIKGVSHYRIIFNGSANIEPKGYKGISHLIEHCMCEKIKDYESLFKEQAISWNACTSETKVWFFISGISKYVRNIIKDYTNSILNYEITKDVFERERNIVITEYYQSYSNQTEAFLLNYNRKHYNFCDPIGYIKDLENLTYEQFMDYKNKVFSNPSDIIYMHHKNEKDLQETELDNITYNNYKVFENDMIYGNYNDYPLETYSEFHNQRIVVLTVDLDLDKKLHNLVYGKLFKTCIAGGLTSPLYQELREKLQCVYSILGYVSKLDNKKMSFTIYINTTENEKLLVKQKFQEVITNIKSYINKKMFKNNLMLFKNAFKLESLTSWGNVKEEDDIKCKDFILSKNINYNDFISFIDKFLKADLKYIIDDEYINLEK